MTKVTVAMASYNHEKFVGATIDSILAQKNCDFDLSIVDDGSSDHSVALIQKYRDPRIKFEAFEKNRGACVALRKAIENGSGEYVAIANSDDIFLPGKLEKQMNFLDQNPHIHAVFAYPQFIDENGKIITEGHFYQRVFEQPNRSRYEWLHFFFNNGNALCHPTVMIRRSCYKTLGYYDPRLNQLPDYDFWLRLLLKHEIHVLPEELIQFRILLDNKNTSAYTPASQKRLLLEFTYALENYLKIDSIEEYLKIFPNEAANVKEKDPELIPFYLAKLAMQTPHYYSSLYQIFGIKTIFSMLGNPHLKDKLEHSLGYTTKEFAQDSGNYLFPYEYKMPSFSYYLKEMVLKKIFNQFRTKIKKISYNLGYSKH